MGWASAHIAKLRNKQTVQFRPKGNSMSGRVESGQLCTVEPVDPTTIQVGDIILCKVHGREFLHLVKATQDGRFQIGNNKGHTNGWVGPNGVYGKLIKVED
jgi:hypothetical protein